MHIDLSSTPLPSHLARASRPWSLIACVLLAFGCAADADDDDDDTGAATTGSGGAGGGWNHGGSSSSGAAGSAGEGGGPVTAPVASWDIVSDIQVNGHDMDSAVKSAVARHEVIDGHDYLSVILTDVPSFCSALQAGDCGQDVHFRLELALSGIEPGTYAIEEEAVSAWFGDLTASCIGGGIGAEGGTVTFHEIDLAPGGSVELEFDLTLFGGHAEGTVVAPLCVVD
jgi:hypothetical protein